MRVSVRRFDQGGCHRLSATPRRGSTVPHHRQHHSKRRANVLARPSQAGHRPGSGSGEPEAQRQREEEGKTVQRPVYYLSEVLSLSKQNYPHFQKMTYGVFMAATKLKHYFEEHPMKVVSEAPISDIMSNKDASGKIAKWAIQISPTSPQIKE
ncbi:hypothetical protein QYE76_004842 [Lolium multiflorum]|uniref:Reverse transcriptase RNase H-like domain-containing protein n=1 Tax=Lolium multiflorum TaxID=4521 RepID=A0AAD8W0L5_LOLMU|nr:hypothetical protein QYE76_004842 [Lolium multiflorum]